MNCLHRRKEMFRVTLACERIGPTDWPDALADIAQEFKGRPSHKIVDCRWDGSILIFVADNDYDENGEALADEFSDTVAAYAPGTPGYRVRILSVTVIGGS